MDTDRAARNVEIVARLLVRRAARVMSHQPAEWDVQETLIARLRRDAELRDEELAALRTRL
jgi:hypothetical protein